jgi:hypothetical protein
MGQSGTLLSSFHYACPPEDPCPVARHESCEAASERLHIEGFSDILHKFNANLVYAA